MLSIPMDLFRDGHCSFGSTTAGSSLPRCGGNKGAPVVGSEQLAAQYLKGSEEYCRPGQVESHDSDFESQDTAEVTRETRRSSGVGRFFFQAATVDHQDARTSTHSKQYKKPHRTLARNRTKVDTQNPVVGQIGLICAQRECLLLQISPVETKWRRTFFNVFPTATNSKQ